MSSNISSAPAYGVYASQLICYACFCSNKSDFLFRHSALVTGLLLQGYKVKVNAFELTIQEFETFKISITADISQHILKESHVADMETLATHSLVHRDLL